MKFLEKHWDDIQSDLPDECPPEYGGPLQSWIHSLCDMDRIVKALKIIQPKRIIELGTFVALGTLKMDQVIDNGTIWTLDSNLPIESDITMGINIHRTVENWKEKSLWEGWDKVLAERWKNLKQCKNTVYVEGIIIETLPKILEIMHSWDFCFQDSVHHGMAVVQEWSILKPYAKKGSIIVFDDVLDNGHDFYAWFLKNEQGWETRYTGKGHGQLWVEKI